MRDYDDYSQDTHDPFQRAWHQRIVAHLLGAIARLSQLVLRPLQALGTMFAVATTRAAIFCEASLGRFRAGLGRLWWRLAHRLRLDEVERKVSHLHASAARSVDEISMTVAEHTTHSSWMRAFGDRLAAGRHRIQLLWDDFVQWAQRTWFTRLVTSPLRWSVTWTSTLFDFSVGWLWTRQYRQLLFGIPAVLLMMPLAYCAVRLPFYTREAKAQHYRRAADEAIVAREFEKAELYFRKLAQLGDAHDRVLMRSALLAEEQGRLAEAYAQMQQLAPLDHPGDPRAHLWIAQRISNGMLEANHPDRINLARVHIDHALARHSNDPALNVWLGQIYLQNGRVNDCLALLEKTRVDGLTWPLRVGVAEMYAMLGQFTQSREILKPVLAHYQQQLERGKKLSRDDYMNWATAAEIDSGLPNALNVLSHAVNEHPEDETIRDLLGRIGVTYFDQLQQANPDAAEQHFRLLEDLLSRSAGTEQVLIRLAQMTLVPSIEDRALQLLAEREQSGKLPAMVHKTLGDAAAIREDFAAARAQYLQAVELDPELHVALNNLAYLMSSHPPLELAESLAMANRAILLDPHNPHYLETRGQIYVRLKQWQEAVDDLTMALNALPSSREIHAALATAYRGLGQDETAQLHAEQAAR